jgi:single-stranded-DNA-specific exonuclease
VELLTTDSEERAKDLARYVQEMNDGRSSIERSIYLAANKHIKEEVDLDAEAALVLANRGWHPGVIGIVAGRLADKYARPVVMIALDDLGRRQAVGSARSALGVDLHGVLTRCATHLMSFGGHAAAAGLRIDEAQLEAFRQAFCRHVAEFVPPERRHAQLVIDAESPLAQLTLQTVTQIEQLAPFGEGNPRPLLCASSVLLDGDPRTMGDGGRHLSVKLRQGSLAIRAVAFGHVDEWGSALKDHRGCLDVAYRPVINHFGGRRSVEMHLVDWRPAIA